MWIAQHKTTREEFILDWVAERKNHATHDFSVSISDGRMDDQSKVCISPIYKSDTRSV